MNFPYSRALSKLAQILSNCEALECIKRTTTTITIL